MSDQTNLHFKIDLLSSSTNGNEQLESSLLLLQAEIDELKPESIQRPSVTNTNPGRKTGNVLTIGTLLVAVVPEVAKHLVTLLFDWVKRNPERTITICNTSSGHTYKVSGSWTADELKKVMDASALDRHKGDPTK